MSNVLRLSLVLSALTFCVGVASADNLGAVGTIAGLQIHTTSTDDYLQYHGRILVKPLVKKADGSLDEYRWGGTSCGTRVMTEAQVAALHHALSDTRARIEPKWQAGQGQALCLVGFTLVPKSYLKSVFP